MPTHYTLHVRGLIKGRDVTVTDNGHKLPQWHSWPWWRPTVRFSCADPATCKQCCTCSCKKHCWYSVRKTIANSAAARSVFSTCSTVAVPWIQWQTRAGYPIKHTVDKRMAARLQRSFGWDRMEKDMAPLTTFHDIIEQNMIAVMHGLIPFTPTNSLLPPTQRLRHRPCGAAE